MISSCPGSAWPRMFRGSASRMKLRDVASHHFLTRIACRCCRQRTPQDPTHEAELRTRHYQAEPGNEVSDDEAWLGGACCQEFPTSFPDAHEFCLLQRSGASTIDSGAAPGAHPPGPGNWQIPRAVRRRKYPRHSLPIVPRSHTHGSNPGSRIPAYREQCSPIRPCRRQPVTRHSRRPAGDDSPGGFRRQAVPETSPPEFRLTGKGRIKIRRANELGQSGGRCRGTVGVPNREGFAEVEAEGRCAGHPDPRECDGGGTRGARPDGRGTPRAADAGAQPQRRDRRRGPVPL